MDLDPAERRRRRLATRLAIMAAAALTPPIATVLGIVVALKRCGMEWPCDAKFWRDVALPALLLGVFIAVFTRRRFLRALPPTS
jgi:hypothetical protein